MHSARGGRRRRRVRDGRGTSTAVARYVELHAHSAYSFLDGASLPEELAARAAELGYDALALTDHDGVYGSLEFAHAAKHFGVRPITGAEVTSSAAHTSRCSARRSAATRTSAGSSPTRTPDARAREGARPAAGRDDARRRRRSTPKGSSPLRLRAARARRRRPERQPRGSRVRSPARSTSSCSVRTSAATPAGTRGCAELAETLGVPTVATGDVHAHHQRRARLQDALVAIRHRTSLDGCERERRGNHEIGPALAGRDARAAAARRRAAHARGRRALRLRPDAGARLPLPRLLRRRRPADVQLRAICDRAFEERYANANGHKRRARERLDDELALICAARPRRVLPAPLGGARARARVRARGARPRQPAARAAARGAGAARASARSSAT